MSDIVHRPFMDLAIAKAKENLKSLAGGPFGACIVKNGKVIAVAANKVLKCDPTAHAEMNAIRLAAKRLKTFDLTGCVVYSTTEPCPMCFSAVHWAKIKTIIYGTTISDAAAIGFNELKITNIRLNRLGKAKIRLVPGVMRPECLKLFADWDKLPQKQLY